MHAGWKEATGEGSPGRGNSGSKGLSTSSEHRLGGGSFQSSSGMWVTPTHSRHRGAHPTQTTASTSSIPPTWEGNRGRGCGPHHPLGKALTGDRAKMEIGDSQGPPGC